MNRQKELRDILDTIMAWCAEVDLLGRPPVPNEEQASACEVVGRLDKVELHQDWNGVLAWALRQVCELQVKFGKAVVSPRRGAPKPPFRDEQLVSALLNVIALCTLWIRQIESRPDPPSVLGAIRASTLQHLKIRK